MNVKVKTLLNAGIAVMLLAIALLSYDLINTGSRDADLPEDALALEIEALQARLANNGNDPYDWMDLANLYRLRGDREGAMRALRQALAISDLIPEQRYALMVRLADVQLDLGQLADAWETATAASKINPDRAPAFNRRGDVRSTEGRRIAALTEYETAGRVEPGHAESYAKRAALLGECGDTAGAEALLQEGVQKSDAENAAAAALNMGRFYLKRGQVDRAVRVLKSAAEKHPNDAAIWAALGEAYDQQSAAHARAGKKHAAGRSRDLAVAAYERAAALDPRDAALRERLGDLYVTTGENDSAHRTYRDALRYDRDNDRLKEKYLATGSSKDLQMVVREDGAIVLSGGGNGAGESGANVQSGSGGTGESAHGSGDSVLVSTTDANGRPVTVALPNLYDSNSREQPDAAALKTKGRDLFLKQKYPQALVEFNKAADVDPRDSEARYLSGRTYAQLGRQDAATEAYEEAIRLDPKDYRPHYHLGELHYQYRRYGQASAAFANAVQVKPDLDTARYNLALSQTKNNQISSAIQTYRELLRRDPNRWQAALNLAILLKQKNDSAGALELLERYTRSHPKEAALHYQKGEVHTARGEIAPAIAAFSRTVQIEPKHFQAHYNTGVLYSRQGNRAAALAAYEQARQINDDDPDLHYAIGRLQKQSGETTPAIAALERCLSLKAGHADAAIEVVPLYLQLGRKLDAIATMQRATRANSQDYRLQFNAGNLYRKLSEHSEARAAYQQAIRLQPGRADAYLNLALSYRDTGEDAAAIATYRSLLASQPTNPAANEQLGLLLWKDPSSRDSARKHLEQYLELQPQAANAGDIRRLLAGGTVE